MALHSYFTLALQQLIVYVYTHIAYKLLLLDVPLTLVIIAVAIASAQRAANRNKKKRVAQQPILIRRKLGPLTTLPGFGGGLSM